MADEALEPKQEPDPINQFHTEELIDALYNRCKVLACFAKVRETSSQDLLIVKTRGHGMAILNHIIPFLQGIAEAYLEEDQQNWTRVQILAVLHTLDYMVDRAIDEEIQKEKDKDDGKGKAV